MTAQIHDPIYFEGRWRPLATEPLGDWLRRRRNRHIRFRTMHTACRRGYRATWEVHRGRLYLTGFHARLVNGRFAGLRTLFESWPEQYLRECGACEPSNQRPGRFAFWVTGTIWSPLGPVLQYRHIGYARRYAAWLGLVFDAGFLVGQRIVQDGASTGKSCPEDAC